MGKEQWLFIPSICFDCARATVGTACKQDLKICSWASDFTPVPGWKADERNILVQWKTNNVRRVKHEKSYRVKACPLFVADKIRKREVMYDD